MKSYFNNKIYLAKYTPNIITSTVTLALFQVFLWLVATLLDSADLEQLDRTSLECWKRQWHLTPVFLPGKSHGRRSLVGCSPWGP